MCIHSSFHIIYNQCVVTYTCIQVLQIFYPHSIQLYPDTFPGSSPNDCPKDISKKRYDDSSSFSTHHHIIITTDICSELYRLDVLMLIILTNMDIIVKPSTRQLNTTGGGRSS